LICNLFAFQAIQCWPRLEPLVIGIFIERRRISTLLRARTCKSI